MTDKIIMRNDTEGKKERGHANNYSREVNTPNPIYLQCAQALSQRKTTSAHTTSPARRNIKRRLHLFSKYHAPFLPDRYLRPEPMDMDNLHQHLLFRGLSKVSLLRFAKLQKPQESSPSSCPKFVHADLVAYAEVLGDRRVFTRKSFEGFAKSIEKVCNPKNSEKIYLRDVITKLVWDPKTSPFGKDHDGLSPEFRPLFEWNSYVEMAYPRANGTSPYVHEHNGTPSTPIVMRFKFARYSGKDSDSDSESRGNINTALEFKSVHNSWQKSSTRRFLREITRKNAKEVRRIKKIVCFGLGSFPGRVYDSHTLQSHHKSYEETDGFESSPIPIFAQDPAYTHADKALFRRFPSPNRVVDDPHGFMALDKPILAYFLHRSVQS